MDWKQQVLAPPESDSSQRNRLVALAAVGTLAACVAWLWAENRALRRELVRERTGQHASAARELELTGAVAAQHRELADARAELQSVEYRMQAVEMQLDGIDLLSQQVRDELELPPSPGTWGGAATDPVPQGGSEVPAGSLMARTERITQRLRSGYDELDTLLVALRGRDEPAAHPASPTAPERAVALPLNWPARGRVTSPFGWRVFRGRPNYHTGIDVAMPFGTPVQATGPGDVVGSGWQPGYGWSVLVRHDGGYHTLYAHLSGLVVSVGDEVTIADVVGLSGSSGHSTGPHLHYEIWRDGVRQDPRPYMDGQGPR